MNQPPSNEIVGTALDSFEDAHEEEGDRPAADTMGETRPGAEMRDQDGDAQRRRRRRGRRGGRRRRRGGDRMPMPEQPGEEGAPSGLQFTQDDRSPNPSEDTWVGEDHQAPAPYDAGGPSESSTEPAVRYDEHLHHTNRSDEREHREQVVDNGREPVEPQRHIAPAEPAEGNGNGAAPTGTEPEPVDQPASGPPKRGWWKRLIE